MSIARKAGLLVGVIGAASTLASVAEGGEGGRGKRIIVVSPYPYYVVAPAPVYAAPVYVAPPPPVMYAPQPYYGGPRGSVYFGATIPLR